MTKTLVTIGPVSEGENLKYLNLSDLICLTIL